MNERTLHPIVMGWAVLLGCSGSPSEAGMPPAASAGAETPAAVSSEPGATRTGGLEVSVATSATGAPQAISAPATGGPAGARWAAVVAASDREPADLALDAGRQPAVLLAFMGVEPSMRVAEIAAGAGYTSELLARAVGPEGQVYAVNNAFVLNRFAQAPWTKRLEKAVMKNVVRLDREFDDPFPSHLSGLDLVCNILFYHDSVWQESDRSAMNKAVFDALRPGGHYVIVDHSARTGRGLEDVKTLHRIEESVLRVEIEAAGFQFVARSAFLGNPDDARDWNAAPSAAGNRRGTSDRFALRFIKPGPPRG